MQYPLRISLLLAFSYETIVITVDFTSSDHRYKSYKHLTLFNFCLQSFSNSLSNMHSLYWFYFVWLDFSPCFLLLLFASFCFTRCLFLQLLHSQDYLFAVFIIGTLFGGILITLLDYIHILRMCRHWFLSSGLKDYSGKFLRQCDLFL